MSKKFEDELLKLIHNMRPTCNQERYPVEKIVTMYKNNPPYEELEAIIDREGLVVIARRGHVNTLIGEYMRIHKDENLTEDDIWKRMPITASPIVWLIDHTGCIAIWKKFREESKLIGITPEQKCTVEILDKNNIARDMFREQYIKEKYKKRESYE